MDCPIASIATRSYAKHRRTQCEALGARLARSLVAKRRTLPNNRSVMGPGARRMMMRRFAELCSVLAGATGVACSPAGSPRLEGWRLRLAAPGSIVATEEATLLASDGAPGDQLGDSVALSA